MSPFRLVNIAFVSQLTPSQTKMRYSMTDTTNKAQQIIKIWDGISSSLGKSTPKLLEIGLLIAEEKTPTKKIAGKTLLGKTKFKKDPEADKERFENLVKELPFAKPTANKFAAFATDKHITKHQGILPPSYNTLYELRMASIASKALNISSSDFKTPTKAHYAQVAKVWSAMVNGYETAEAVMNVPAEVFKLSPLTTQSELLEFFTTYAEKEDFRKKEKKEDKRSSNIASIVPFAQANDFLKSQESCVLNYPDITEEIFSDFSEQLIGMVEKFNKANGVKIDLNFFNSKKLELFTDEQVKASSEKQAAYV